MAILIALSRLSGAGRGETKLRVLESPARGGTLYVWDPTQTAITYHNIPATRDNNTETGTRHNMVLARPRRSALAFLVMEKRLLLFSQGLKASHSPCMLESFNTWGVEPPQG